MRSFPSKRRADSSVSRSACSRTDADVEEVEEGVAVEAELGDTEAMEEVGCGERASETEGGS